MSESAEPLSPDEILESAGWLRSLARSLVQDPHAAEDIAQETWLAALRCPPRRSIRGWLGTVVRNAAHALRLADRRRTTLEAHARPPSPLPGPAELAERVEIQRRLLDMVQSLREPYRTTVLLRYLQGLEPSEIARQTGEPAGTVRSRLHRALRILREKLDGSYGGGPRAQCAILLFLGETAPETTGAAASVGGAIAGGLVVSSKMKIAAGVAILLLLTLAVWRLPERPASPPSAPSVAPQAHLDAHEVSPAPSGEQRASEDAESPEEVCPEPPLEQPTSEDASAQEGPAKPLEEPPPRPGTVAGRVTLLDGTSQAGIQLRLTKFSERVDPPELHGLRRSAEADEDGRFQLDDLPPGNYRLAVSLEGFATHYREFRLTQEWGAGPLRIVLRRGGSIVALVVGPEGEPRSGRWVKVWDRNSVQPLYARTDEEGVARIEHLESGTYSVETRSSGRRAVTVPASGSVKVTIKEAASEAAEVFGEVVLPEGGLPGRAGARVSLTPVRYGRDLGNYDAFTNEEGRYRIQGVRPGTYWVTVQVLVPFGYVAEAGQIVVTHGQMLEFHARITRTRLAGRVTRWDGRPLKPIGASVWAWKVRLDGGRIVKRGPGLLTLTDDEGCYRFCGVRPGFYELKINPRSDRSLAPQVRIIEIPRDGSLEGVDFTLKPRGVGTVRVRVLETDGTPASGVSFRSKPKEGEGLEWAAIRERRHHAEPGVTDLRIIEGQYVLRVIRAGSRTLPETLEVTVTEGCLLNRAVRLVPTGLLHLGVIGPDGSSVPGLKFAALPQRAPQEPVRSWSVRDEDGTYRIWLEPGALEVRVLRDGEVAATLFLEVRSFGTVERVVTLN